MDKAEKLYKAVKSGQIKLEDLNESGKQTLRQYMGIETTTKPKTSATTAQQSKSNVNPKFAEEHPKITKILDVVSTPLQKLFGNQNVQRMAEKTADEFLLTNREQQGREYTPATSETAQTVTDVGGAVVGSLPAFSKIYKGLDIAASKLPTAAQKVNPLVVTGTKGAVAGGAYEGAVGVGHDLEAEEIAKRAAIGAIAGGIGDAAITKLPELARAITQDGMFSTPKGVLENLDLRNPHIYNANKLPAGPEIKLLPEWASETPGQPIRQPGVTPLAQLPMTQAEVAGRQQIDNTLNTRLLTGDTVITPTPPPQQPTLPMASFETQLRQDMARQADTPLLPGRTDVVWQDGMPNRKLLPDTFENVPAPEARTFEDVGNKKVKALSFEYPELKPYYQQEANRLLGDLKDTTKGKRTYVEVDGDMLFGGDKRLTSDSIARIKDETKASYADIGRALTNIVHDKGLENNALSKKIELIIDDDLTHGTRDITGMELPPTREYIAAKEKIFGKPKASDEVSVDEFLDALDGKVATARTQPQPQAAKGSPELRYIPADTPRPTTSEADLNAARSVLKSTKKVDTAAKVLRVYPELRNEFKMWSKRVDAKDKRATQQTKPVTTTTQEPYIPTVELNAARGALHTTKNMDRAAKILDTYPELKPEFKKLIKQIEKAQKEKSATPKTGTQPAETTSPREYELNAARIALKRTNSPERAAKIMDAYPELKGEFAQAQQAKKTKSSKAKGGKTAGKAKGKASKSAESLKQTKAGTKKKPLDTEKAKTALDNLEEAARERIKQRKGRVMSGIPVDDLVDYSIIGATKIAKKGLDFAEWSAEMVSEFGDDLKPYLQSIYQKSNDILERGSDAINDTKIFDDAASVSGTAGKKPAVKQTAPDSGSNRDDALAAAFRNKVNRNAKKKGSFSEIVNRFQSQLVDDVAELGKLEKKVHGKLASAEDSLYKQARLFKGTGVKANSIVVSKLAPIVQDIEKKGYTSLDLGDYALAVHARDVNAKGIESGFTDDKINAVITKYGTPEMEAARKKLVQFSNSLLEEQADAQVISKELVATLKEKHPNYMPLFRYFDDDKIEFADGLSRAMANVTSPLKRLKGSERDVIDPLESMVKNVFHATNAADRNRVALQLLKLADKDTTGQYIKKLNPNENRSRKNAVYARVNGEKQYLEVEPEVYKAILGLDKESSDMLIKLLQKPAAVLRAGATLTPEFSLRNPMRDIVQAYIVSNSGFNPLRDIPAAFIDMTSKDKKLLRQFLGDRAGYGNIVSQDRDAHREALHKVLKQPASEKFVNVVTGKSLIGLLRSVADFSETMTKLGEYRAALRSGASRPEAAYRARDIMDFGRAGSSIREANKVVAFMNANIQGKSKLLRAIRENPKGTTVRALKSVTMPSIGIFLAQKYFSNKEQQQTIDEAPAWLKDTFWLLPIPGTNQIARIPKPFDVAPFFANLPERTLDYVYNNDKKAFDDYATETLATLSIPVMISGILPIIEGIANYSFFRQAPIIPRREESIKQVDQGDVNTTQTAKAIAKATYGVTQGEGPFKNLGSPRVIDHIILGLTAGLGRYATSAIDVVIGSDGPPRPIKKVSEYPLLRAFLVNENTSSSAIDTLYSHQDKLRREKGSAKNKKEPFRDAGRLKAIETATGHIGNMSSAMRKIENDPKMSPALKRKKLDTLRKKRDELARRAVKRIGI